MAITLAKYIELGRELTYSEVDNNWAVIEDAINAKAESEHSHAISNVSGLQSALDGKVPLTQKASPNGVATLNSEGKIPLVQVPNFTLQAVPAGGWIWFRGAGNDEDSIQAGDGRLRFDGDGNFVYEKYNGTDWAASSGEG